MFELVGRLVKRPPGPARVREGIPILELLGTHDAELGAQIDDSAHRSDPRSVPHRRIDMDALWAEVVRDRGAEGTPRYLDHDWQRTELCRRSLVKLAQEFSSDSYGPDQRVRFRRFGMVNWLLQTTDSPEEPDSQHGRLVIRRLRDREFARRRLFRLTGGSSAESALTGQVQWWAQLFGLVLAPLIWFRLWRLVGQEYRWLLKQPYMAPADPGTFTGFALRLTQPRWGREDPEQISRLMVNAFLEDLRVAYRRRHPLRPAGYRRTAHCTAWLQGATAANGGRNLARLIATVRNDTGAFDPLLLVLTRPEDPREPVQVRNVNDDPSPYDAWLEELAGPVRDRSPGFWYLPVRIPAPVPPDDPDVHLHAGRTARASRWQLPRPPRWAGRTVRRTVAALLVLATVATTAAYVRDARADEAAWSRRHCGLDRGDPDAATVWKTDRTNECVGIAPHGFAFGAADARVRTTLRVITRQNEEAERIHEATPDRPLITLIHLSALLSSPGGHPSGSLAYAREQLQGAAAAQRRQLDATRSNAPVVRIFTASAGSGMRYGRDVGREIGELMRTDPTIAGVTGLDQSRSATVDTIAELTRIGLPMIATTLSADSLPGYSALYMQVSPQNRREADIAAAYARHMLDEGRLKKRSVRIMYSLDPSDTYSSNLRDDATRSFESAGFHVTRQGYAPDTRLGNTLTGATPSEVGKTACGYEGLVFFTGRTEDFMTVAESVNTRCGHTPPAFLGGDDIGRLGADPDKRRSLARVPYEFLDFTVGSAGCDGQSDLYATMRQLFPEECASAPDTSLDGHAALAFDAVNLHLTALAHLQDTAPRLPLTPAALWHGLSGIHGDDALDGESGKIDFGGVVDQQVPIDKLISVQHVEGGKRPRQIGFCGLLGGSEQSSWCPEPEIRRSH
ncbi:type 1 periplasmic-binding domain-containing protein [Streptomyces smaragdinus]|uniref:hypothetical protein n=1 Tax=Streptomyces smaragdinus TaxID=2585196 RepID=UPI001294B340|nr:hypothetical protein [Streptomyces smaragdinus]